MTKSYEHFFSILEGQTTLWTVYNYGFISKSLEIIDRFESNGGFLEFEFKSKRNIYILIDALEKLEQSKDGDILQINMIFKDSEEPRIEVKVPELIVLTKEKYVEKKRKEYINNKPSSQIVNIKELQTLTRKWEKEFDKKVDEHSSRLY